jgi:DNA-binding transcriptional MocR family regulator
MMTNGVSQALDMICTVFTQPGDVVIVEEPTYFLALRIFADHGLRVVCAPMDGAGLLPGALQSLLDAEHARLVYTIPTHQNPSGATLSAARRAEVLEICRAHNALLVADEVYHLLTYDGSPPRPFAAWADDPTVFALGSFSKLLAPGLRLGWLHAAPARMEALTAWGAAASGGGLGPFTSSLVQSLLELDLLRGHVETLRRTYAARRDALVDALQRHAGQHLRFALPEGGYFLWAEQVQPVDVTRLTTAAAAERIDFRAGSRFSSRGGLERMLRLCFAYYDEDTLAEGVRRLVRALEIAGA